MVIAHSHCGGKYAHHTECFVMANTFITVTFLSIHAKLWNNTLNERGFAPALHYRSPSCTPIRTLALTHSSNDPTHHRASISARSHPTQEWVDTATIAFRHLALNAATFGHATEGAHDSYISAQLFTGAVSDLRNVWDSGSSIASKHARRETWGVSARVNLKKKKKGGGGGPSRSRQFWFRIKYETKFCAGNVGGYKT